MTRAKVRRRLALGASVLALATLASPATARADAAGPTDYRTDIVSITADDPGLEAELDRIITVTVEGGDAFVRVEVARGHEVQVLGYETDPGPEPYLLIDADGAVFENVRSYATYYNQERYGGTDIPDVVDNAAPPEWRQIGSGGAWAWHDHRAHYMGTERLIGMQPGDSFPTDVVPLVVDGVPVSVEVRTTLLDDPAWLPPAFGALIGLQLVLLASLAGPATTVLGGTVLAVLACVAGVVQFRSLPSETGPLLTWWLMPVLAVIALVVTVAIYGRSLLVERGLVALAGLLLVMWAFLRRDGLTRAIVPTDLPGWFDRMITAGVLLGGAALVVIAVRDLFRVSPTA